MPNAMTTAQLQSLLQGLNSASSDGATLNQIAGAISGVYNTMSANGYGYANLASGLVTGSTFSGDVAKNFMTNFAAENGTPMSAQTVTNIKLSMAQGYLQTLIADSNATGQVTSDI